MVLKEVEQLAREYDLTELDITRLETEFELIRLKVQYVLHKCETEEISFYDSLVKYAGLKRFTQQLSADDTRSMEEDYKKLSPDQVDEEQILRELFQKSDYIKDICNHIKRDGCFQYDLWKDEGVSLHFGNAVIPKNPFKGEELEHRKEELKKIADDIRQNHPKLKYVFSVSWMWNYKIFQDLMPKEFNKSLKEFKENNFYSLGHWGQFYRHDGKLNKDRVKQFKDKWEFPLSILLGECEIKSVLEKYN